MDTNQHTLVVSEMHFSENCNEIFGALAEAQLEMQVAEKDSTNPFHKSNYADIQRVMEAVRPPLNKKGICLSQMHFCNNGESFLLTVLGHKSGQWMRSVSPIWSKDKTAQGFASANTLTRRTAALSISGCAQGEKDDDGNKASGMIEHKNDRKLDEKTGEIYNYPDSRSIETHPMEEKKEEQKPQEIIYLSEKQMKMLFGITAEHLKYRDLLIKRYESLSKIPASDVNKILEHFAAWKSNQLNKNSAKESSVEQTSPAGVSDDECPF